MRTQQRRYPSPSSPSSLSEDWNSEWTELDDKHLRYLEEKEQGPRTGCDQEQLRQIQERIVKRAGQDDNGILARWLDHLPMHLHLNRTCGPDNELVQLPVLYNSLEGVAEEWYLDFILHARKSWAFEKAVHSIFLTYTFGLTANPAVQESTEVRYSRMESRHKYEQCRKVKAQWLAQEPGESRMVVQSLFPEEEEVAVLKCQGIFRHNENGQANQLHPQVTGGSSWGKTAKHPLISDSHQVSYYVHPRPPHSQQGLAKMEGRTHSSTGSADSTINHTLRLCLQGQVLGSALEMENFRFQGELNDLREWMHHDHQPDGEHPVAAPLSPGNTGQSRSCHELAFFTFFSPYFS